jgi:polyisoprenoid-binding protein YceI
VSAVEGELTLLGKSLPVSLKAQRFNCYISPLIRREICGGDFETTIRRGDFGMDYKLSEIANEVHLVIQIEAIKQTP